MAEISPYLLLIINILVAGFQFLLFHKFNEMNENIKKTSQDCIETNKVQAIADERLNNLIHAFYECKEDHKDKDKE